MTMVIPNAAVWGRVLNNGAPAAGVVVEVSSINQVASAVAANDGSFAFTTLEPGNYEAQVQGTSWRFTVPGAGGFQVDVATKAVAALTAPGTQPSSPAVAWVIPALVGVAIWYFLLR